MTTAAPWKDPVFEKWWPLGQSLTLVRAPIRRVARAMKAEERRAYGSTGAVCEFDWIRRQSIDDLFGFEVPADSQSANDTSWFALALECEACGLARIAYEDETV